MILTFYFISFVYMLSLKIQQLEAELNEMKKQWKSSQKALEQAQQQGLPIPRGLIILSPTSILSFSEKASRRKERNCPTICSKD